MKPRLLTLTSSFPRWDGDYAGLFVAELNTFLARQYDITVLAPMDARVDAAWRPSGQEVVRFPVFRAPFDALSPFYRAGGPENLTSRSTRLLLPVSVWPMWNQARRLARRHEAMLAHWLVPAGMVGALLTSRRLPLTVVVHGGCWHLLKRQAAGREMARFVLRRAARVLTVAQYLRDEMLAAFPEAEREEIGRKLHVVTMGLFTQDYAPTAPRSHDDHPLRVLCVGRLVPIKGIERLIGAMRGCAATLWVVGDGPESAQLKAYANEASVHVKFFGAVSPARLRGLYAEADVFAFPSRPYEGRVEGAPRVLLEAMAAGLPIVASRTGGVTELVTHEENGLVDDQDDAALAAHLCRLLDDDALRARLSQAARTQAARYDWSRVGPLFAPEQSERRRP